MAPTPAQSSILQSDTTNSFYYEKKYIDSWKLGLEGILCQSQLEDITLDGSEGIDF